MVKFQIDKAYPRDFMQVGRVRVQLKREDGTFLNPAITSSKTSNLHSWFYLCSLLESRTFVVCVFSWSYPPSVYFNEFAASYTLIEIRIQSSLPRKHLI